MKKRGIVFGLSGLLMAAALLAGCGGSSSEKYESSASADTGNYYEYSDDVYATTEEMAVEEAPAEENTAAEAGEVQDNRKLIKNVDMNVETEDFEKLIANVESKINTLGGYAENKKIGGRSYNSEAGNRYASITARIPSDRLEEFVSAVAKQSNVTSKNESVNDVTLQYVDMEAHRDSLRTEQERLNELLAQAEDLETIIALEERLTEVRYQLESYESQLRSMDNQVDYSTVYLYISEVERLTPQAEKSPWEKMRVGFAESVYNVGKGLQNFGIGFVIALPYLITMAIIIGVIVAVVLFIVKLAEKSTKKKRQKRQQTLNSKQQSQVQQNQPQQSPQTMTAPQKETKE